MHSTFDEDALGKLLPGTWIVAATNFPMWLNGERLHPRFSYGLVSSSPLVLSDEVSYETAETEKKPSETKTIVGQDVFNHDEFVWRGKGVLRFFASHWSVSGASDDGNVVAIHFTKSMATPAGIDIIIRESVEVPELRALIARNTEQFGLSPEDFASLSWLAPGHSH